MKKHLNTLFVTTEDAYLRKDGSAVAVKVDGECKLRIPLHNLDGIVTFGWDTVASASLMAACAEYGVSLSFHSPHGKFLASAQGAQSGNVLLRRAQYRASESDEQSLAIAKNCVSAKIANARTVIRRAYRDHSEKHSDGGTVLEKTAENLKCRLSSVQRSTTLDELRGIEGDTAATYFSVFNHLLMNADPSFTFRGRTRRPPLDEVNALLSFHYMLLSHDIRSACESVGLDPQCGFLHRDRPGRPSLALDLMEEFRCYLADRATLTLLNRQQIKPRDFEKVESGAVLLKEKAKKRILEQWQIRKQDELTHPYLLEKTTVGLLPFLQARLLARYLRGDLDGYPAFLSK